MPMLSPLPPSPLLPSPRLLCPLVQLVGPNVAMAMQQRRGVVAPTSPPAVHEPPIQAAHPPASSSTSTSSPRYATVTDGSTQRKPLESVGKQNRPVPRPSPKYARKRRKPDDESSPDEFGPVRSCINEWHIHKGTYVHMCINVCLCKYARR